MPTLGPLLELTLVQPLNAAKKSIEGRDDVLPTLARQTIQDLKGFVPFSNAWYAKAALDHLILHQVMEALNPGYLRSMRRRTAREFDQQWWWSPGETTPERLPDFKQAIE